MSLVAVLVFLFVVGTVGALVVLTSMIDRVAAEDQPYAAPARMPAPRDGALTEVAVQGEEVGR